MEKSGFAYVDGGEADLLRLFEPENEDALYLARRQPSNWEILYHLSPIRANILRLIHFPEDQEIHILEIGAGCGALTEYLVSLGKHVHVTAVEGDAARLSIIKKRCGHAVQLELIETNIMEYESERKFDYVLSVGVMEYSGRYVSGNNPYQAFIGHAASFLKEDGKFVLAIENPLGHKYIAGIPEDHYNIKYESLVNYPHDTGIKTFDKTTLKRMIESVGLLSQQWYYPFPDYKLPEVILSEQGVCSRDFDWLSLLWIPRVDPGTGQRADFNEKEFLKLLANNVDVTAFMNSFLVICCKQKIADDHHLLGVKFNTQRSDEYKKNKWFVGGEDDEICVQTTNVYGELLSSDRYFKNYKNLHHEIVDAFFREDIIRLQECFKIWYEVLISYQIEDTSGLAEKFAQVSIDEFKVRIYSDNDKWLDVNCLDLVPRNILINDENQDVQVIDLEWIFKSPVPFQLVLNRGMHDLVDYYNILNGGGMPYSTEGGWNLPKHLLEELPKVFNPVPIDTVSAELVEIWLGRLVEGLVPPVRPEDVESVCRARDYYVQKRANTGQQYDNRRPFIKKVAVSLARMMGRSRVVRRMAEHVVNISE